jgi:hypothetical protein
MGVKMDYILLGGLLGVIYGVIDIIPMHFMDDFANKRDAMLAAFIERFSIGLLIGVADFGVARWIQGLAIGILLSLPSAIITRAYKPIMGTGIIGGLLIGILIEIFGT